MIKKISAILLSTMLVLVSAFTFNVQEADAGTAYISCPGSVTQGQSFTATITYSGVAAVGGSWSYDSSVFSLIGGSSTFYDIGVNDTSYSFSITLVAHSTGSGYVSASTSTVSDSNGNELTDLYGSRSASVSVSAPAAPSKPSSGGSSSGGSSASKKKSKTDDSKAKDEEKSKKEKEEEAKKKAEEEKKKSQKPATIEVDVAGTKYTINEKFNDVPEGFEKAEFEYGQYKWMVSGIKSNDGKFKLLKLKNSATGENSWMFFDEATSQLNPNTTLSAKDIMAIYANNTDKGLSTPVIVALAGLGLAVIVLAVLLIATKKKYAVPKKTIGKSPLEEQPRQEINTKDYSDKH